MQLPVKQRILRVGLAVAVGLAIPTAGVLAKGPNPANNGHGHADQHKPTNTGKPAGKGKPETAGKPEDAGSRPHNHGWFVSQVAKSNATSGRAHGQAVSTEAQTEDGK